MSMPAPGWYSVREKTSGKFEGRWAQPRLDNPAVWTVKGETFTSKTLANQYARDKARHYEEYKAGKRALDYPIDDALSLYLARPEIAASSHGANEFVLTRFVARHALKNVSQLTEALIVKERTWLIKEKPDSPGGQWNVLKTVRAFCRYCVNQKWLDKNPFPDDVKLPKSDKEGRALSEDEFAKMISIRNDLRCIESDTWMRRWLILQRYTLTRISTMFDLMPEDVRNNGTEILIPSMKKQAKVWAEITHPEAIVVMQELLARAQPGQRLFGYWKRITTMREAFRVKAQLVLGIAIRPHDACKVTEVTALDELGMSLGTISAVSNTTAATLSKHYLKPDRKRAFDRVRDMYAQTTVRPQMGGFIGQNQAKTDLNGSTEKVENGQIVDGKRVFDGASQAG
jgi:integrase